MFAVRQGKTHGKQSVFAVRLEKTHGKGGRPLRGITGQWGEALANADCRASLGKTHGKYLCLPCAHRKTHGKQSSYHAFMFAVRPLENARQR
jgi:hypothetical protein